MAIYNHTVLLINLLRPEVRRVMYNLEYGILTVCCGRHKYQVNLQMTETIREVINEGKLTAMWTGIQQQFLKKSCSVSLEDFLPHKLYYRFFKGILNLIVLHRFNVLKKVSMFMMRTFFGTMNSCTLVLSQCYPTSA
jgi:hypothetical protein